VSRDLSILFLGKKGDAFTEKALAFLRARSRSVQAHLGGWGDPLPPDAAAWKGDLLLSYLSRWVVPETLLKSAKLAAINFHPGSPEYPGIGCNNYALYDGAATYGSTCHHMATRVDTGAIVAVRRFPILPTDDVKALLDRTYENQYALFEEILGLVFAGKPLPVSKEHWKKGKPPTRKEFNELSRITPDMTKEEIARRVRATSFGPWKPTVELHGFTFELKTEKGV
jgi:methionyl-tRNA formyltransferase